MDTINAQAGAAVARLRKKLHISQAQLADDLGITRTSVSNIERGQQAMSLVMFCKIADCLHVAPDALLRECLSLRHATLTEEELPEHNIREMINNLLIGEDTTDGVFKIIGGDDEPKKN